MGYSKLLIDDSYLMVGCVEIATFMGLTVQYSEKFGKYVIDDGKNNIRLFNNESEHNYHTNVAMLMGALQKAVSIGATIVLQSHSSLIKFKGVRPYAGVGADTGKTLFIALVRFCAWYNNTQLIK